jgi:hypothetical protein
MPYQAIVTKYHGPTNSRGSRVIASAQAGRKIVPWDHALNSENNHRAAALALANHYGWLDNGEHLEAGAMPDGSGYCFVIVGR